MALIVKRGPVKSEPTKLWDYQVYLQTTWLDHLKKCDSAILERSIQHGYGCHCCTRVFALEVRKKK
jgi:hypothetical protein